MSQDPLDEALDRLATLDITSTVPVARTGDVFRVWRFARAQREFLRRAETVYGESDLLRDLADNGASCDNPEMDDGGWVDDNVGPILRALLAAGWTPPPAPAPSPDALGDPEGAEETLVARDRARQTDPLSSFDPNRLRDLLEQVADHRGGWDNVSNDDLAEVQRTLLADAAYLSGVPARTEP